jgi:hypothetical protein
MRIVRVLIEKQENSIGKLLARVFGEMLFDPESVNFPISINELVAPLPRGFETHIHLAR